MPLPHAALPSAPSHAFPFNIPLLRLHKKEEVEEKAHKDFGAAHAGGRVRAQSADGSAFTALVSNVSPRFSRVLERKSRIPYPLARLAPTEPVERHRGKSEQWRRRRGNVGEHQRNGEAETEGMGGGRRQRTGSGGLEGGWEGHARRKERLKKAR